MNNAFNRLQTASHKLAEVLYNQQGASGGQTTGDEQASSAGAGASGSTGGNAGGGADDVIDAEYVDVDNDKK